jgi:hypothetical protein
MARSSKGLLIVNAKVCIFLSQSHDERDNAGEIFKGLGREIEFNHGSKVLINDTMDPVRILHHVQKMFQDKDIFGPSLSPIDLQRYDVSDTRGAEANAGDENQPSEISSRALVDIVITEKTTIKQVVALLLPLPEEGEGTVQESAPSEQQQRVELVARDRETTARRKRTHQISDYI